MNSLSSLIGVCVSLRKGFCRGGNYFLGCSDFPNCWWRSNVRQDDLRWSPSSRSHAPQSGEGHSDETKVLSLNPQVSPPAPISAPEEPSAQFRMSWELGGQPCSWTVKVFHGDDIVEIVDQDGLITEIPLDAASLIFRRLSNALSISTIANSSDLDNSNLVEAAVKRMVEGKSKPILQVMVSSTHALSFG